MSTYLKKNILLIVFLCLVLIPAISLLLYRSFWKSNINVERIKEHKSYNKTLISDIITSTLPSTSIVSSRNPNNTRLPPPRTGIGLHYDHDVPEINTNYDNKQPFIGDEEWNKEDDIENDIYEMNHSIPEEFTSDFVKPVKFYNSSLNEDDLLYESKRDHNFNKKGDYVSAFSLTGTYRSKSSKIWDPHPEYTLTAFGHKLHLVLNQDPSFKLPETFRVIRILSNQSEPEDLDIEHNLGCYYSGQVKGDRVSAVAVSLCNGMTGYIKTNFGSLLIQPVNQTNDHNGDILHKIWRHSRRNTRHAVSLDMDIQEIEQAARTNLKRTKRSSVDRPLYTMELLLAVDQSMIEFHNNDLQSYLLTLISIVSNIFGDASIGNFIHIKVSNIVVMSEFHSNHRGTHELLKRFCSIVSKKADNYDTAILVTRDQICRNENEKCDTLGLAGLGTICSKQSCSVVQDNGLPAAFTIAHELGHVLNMPHDDDESCAKYNKPGAKKQLHIMSSTIGDDIHPFSWSKCSRHYVSEFLEKEDKLCLDNTPTKFIPTDLDRQPGEIYTLDQQCQLIHGNQSRHCGAEYECRILYCKQSFQPGCISNSLPWADGTPCADNTYWCQKGECVPKNGSIRTPIHGGWSPWSRLSDCSMSCGGGVQESQRECNNPIPEYGGKYCAGARKKYRSCNTHPCPSGSLDPREEQCRAMNGRNLSIPGIRPNVKWIPKYGLRMDHRCKLYCRIEDDKAYFRLSEKVIDGTACSFDSFDKCVNGICRPAGCDNELNSIAKLDKCGVCEGRNDTCEEFTGHFYVSDLYKMQPNYKSYYYHVTVIPKGASNIVITQPGYPDENYIVLRDDQNNSLLNGNQVISFFTNLGFYDGVAIEYNGSNNTIERVNTTYSRKLKRDLIVEIISTLTANTARDNDSLLLTYTYTMDKPEVEIYRWEMQPWSSCDNLCQGRKHRTPVCLNVGRGVKVAPQFCDQTAKPSVEYRDCNNICILSLNVTGISECSAQCGMWGIREKNLKCIQTFTATSRSNIVDMTHCESKFDVNQFEKCQEGCWNFSEWSQCSKSCVTGTQTRTVGCFSNQTRVNDGLCDPKKKPSNDQLIRPCNMGPCWYNEWKTENWGPCNEYCKTNRTVTCLNPSGCTSHKPNSQRNCCKIKYVADWSQCSVKCGSGIKKRLIYCAKVFKPQIKGTPNIRERIDERYCRGMSKPTPKRLEKSCYMRCKWSASNWSQCPADCSDDYQRRKIYCEADRKIIDPSLCNQTDKPATQKLCINCIQRKYVVSKCNCNGWRRRRVSCYTKSGKIPCPLKETDRRERCQPQNCTPQSCKDIKRLHQHRGDREYHIYIRNKPKKIYCHNMSSIPVEYITLDSRENYSIYYGYKTRWPDLCPPISRRHEFPDTNSNAGRTYFRKIRINIPDLRVIENDYTFADVVGVQQPYGSAGDCYNQKGRCPQGDFSINLNGTGFYMKRGTVWKKFGENVNMSYSENFESNPVKKRAFCGGYCGRCVISPNSGLYLDVV